MCVWVGVGVGVCVFGVGWLVGWFVGWRKVGWLGCASGGLDQSRCELKKPKLPRYPNGSDFRAQDMFFAR